MKILLTPCACICLLTLVGEIAFAAPPQKIEVSVERRKGKSVERVDPGFVFSAGDAIRFRFKVNFNGYLYVMNYATSGRYVQLFPKTETGLDNRVVKDREYVLPANDTGWFVLEAPAGFESVYWIVSPAKISDGVSSPSASIEPSPDRMTPRCDDSIFQARGECIDATAGARIIGDSTALPPSVGGKLTAQPRELNLMKNDRTTSVMARENGQAPLVYLFRVAHK